MWGGISRLASYHRGSSRDHRHMLQMLQNKYKRDFPENFLAFLLQRLSSGGFKRLSAQLKIQPTLQAAHVHDDQAAQDTAQDTAHVVAGSAGQDTAHVVVGSEAHDTAHVAAGSAAKDIAHVAAGSAGQDTAHVVAGSAAQDTAHVAAGSAAQDTAHVAAQDTADVASEIRIQLTSQLDAQLRTQKAACGFGGCGIRNL